MSDLPLSESTSPTPGAQGADGGGLRSPALQAAARARRVANSRLANTVTPMPMSALPPSVTPAVELADAMDGSVTLGQDATSTDAVDRLQAARASWWLAGAFVGEICNLSLHE